MREKHIEQALTRAVTAAGGKCYKFVSPGTAGVPDRLIILPNGRVAFAECKAPGKRLRPLQQHRADEIKMLGIPVYEVDSLECIPEVIRGIQTP